MALPKIDKFSYADLIELKSEIEAVIAERRAEEQAKLQAKMAEIAAAAGFELDEVMPVKRSSGRPPATKRGKVAPKYRNPKDPSQTWTGRGRQPNWLVAELNKGKKLDDFLIK